MGGEFRPDHRNVWIQCRGRPFPGIGYHRRQAFGLEGLAANLRNVLTLTFASRAASNRVIPSPREIDGIDPTIDRIGLLTKPRFIKYLQLCIVITSVRH